MKKVSKVASICLALAIIISTVFSTSALAATAYVKSDTGRTVKVYQEQGYTFEMTAIGTNATPVFTTGNSSTIEIYTCKKVGNSYYLHVIAMGGAGTVTDLYSTIPGQKPQLQCVMTVVSCEDLKANTPIDNDLVGFEGGFDFKAYGAVTTDVYKNGKLIHQYAHTCVGDVDVVASYSGKIYRDSLITKAFKAAHPDWHGGWTNGDVYYDYKKYDGVSGYAEIAAFCNNDPNSIKSMTMEQLYQLSGLIDEVGLTMGTNGDVSLDAPYTQTLYEEWIMKMEWSPNDHPDAYETVNGVECESTDYGSF